MNARWLPVLLLIASCSRPAPKPPATPHVPGTLPTDVIHERSSLLDIARGATIVSRSGEAMLTTSALSTIDGDIATFWMSPPLDFPQSIIIALHTRSRIERVGLRSLIDDGFGAKHVSFESSLDGTRWSPLASMTAKPVDDGQWLTTKTTEAAYLRITIPDSASPGRDVRLYSLYASGSEIGPATDARIEGCWSINGSPATFVQHGSRATGVLALGAQPVFLSGGKSGSLWRFQWIRGNDFGYTALAISPDGTHLNAVEWHEEAITFFRGMPWFGERSSCPALKPRSDVALALLHRSGRASLFALQFDQAGRLDATASAEELQSLMAIVRAMPITLIAHEFRQPDSKRNKIIAEREIAALKEALAALGADESRVSYRVAGSEDPRQEPATNAARAIYSSVEVEVRR